MKLSDEMRQTKDFISTSTGDLDRGFRSAINEYLPKVEALEKENESLKQQLKTILDKYDF